MYLLVEVGEEEVVVEEVVVVVVRYIFKIQHNTSNSSNENYLVP